MERLDELVAEARARLRRVENAVDVDQADTFQAGWATSRAIGFLEACTILDPEHAEELLAAFEPVSSVVDVLDAGHTRPEAPRPAG